MEEKSYYNVTRETHKRVEVLLTPELYEKLKAKANMDDYTVSMEVKLAIKEFLSKEE